MIAGIAESTLLIQIERENKNENKNVYAIAWCRDFVRQPGVGPGNRAAIRQYYEHGHNDNRHGKQFR